MSYETAYSLEKKKEYTAFSANQAYHDGILHDYNKFQCSEDCDYPLICVNFKKKSVEWGKPPYFKAAKKGLPHHCKTPTITITSSDSEQGEHTITHDLSKIQLNITLDSGFVESDKEKNQSTSIAPSTGFSKTSKKVGTTNRTEHTNSNTLISIISLYLSSEWDHSISNIQLQDGTYISFNQLFQNIDNDYQLQRTPKIYYGQARVIENPTYFVLKYRYYAYLNNVKSKPSVIVHKSLLEKNKTLLNRLIRLSKSNDLFTLYFYGQMKIERDLYIQFDVDTHTSKFLPNIYIKQ